MNLEESVSAYKSYVDEHRANVSAMYWRLFAPYRGCSDSEAMRLVGVPADVLEPALAEAEKLVDAHDLSKYEPEEFEPYRRHFDPTDEERAQAESGEYPDREMFEAAFAHHCEFNPHHPQHWAHASGIAERDMPLPYIIEMLCDWEAMSVKFGGSTWEWWRTGAGKERACMTPVTEEQVDYLVDALFGAP